MITVLHGSNDLAIRRRSAEITSGNASDEVIDPPTKLTGSITVNEIVNAAFTRPFFSTRRVVVVENFISNFESKSSRAKTAKKDVIDPLIDALSLDFPETTDLVFREGPLSTRNPLLQRLRTIEGVSIEIFPELRQQDLFRFIEVEALSRGLRFIKGVSKRPLPKEEEWRRPVETDPVKLLATSLGGSPDALANEILKLSLYVKDREATVDDVDLLCGIERQATVWQLIDGVLDGDARKTYDACGVLFDTGESTQSLISLIAGRYRMLANVQEMLAEGLRNEAIASRNNIRFGVDKTIDRARRLGPGGPRKALEILVSADFSVKTGKMREQVGFETALAQLLLLSPLRSKGQGRSL